MEDLTILWLDDQRDPEKYFLKAEKDIKKGVGNGAQMRNTKFYNENIFNNYNVNFVWVKNLDEFSNYITENGLPEFISYDRDLTPKGWDGSKGNFPDGLDCVNWLKEYCEENGLKIPRSFVHSANWKHVPELQLALGTAALHQPYSFTAPSGKIKTVDENVKKNKKIHLTENQLKKIVENSVKRVLNEGYYGGILNVLSEKLFTASKMANELAKTIKQNGIGKNNPNIYRTKLGFIKYNIETVENILNKERPNYDEF